MKKLWSNLARDLWIVVMDIVAVNVSYFLAVLFRFYINKLEFRPVMGAYLDAWASFTPFYTVLCIVVFALFRLYGGMWRYAGINDMNRIIGANAVTLLIQLLGTALFIRRMPFAYYIVGAVLQFFLVAIVRFGYRIFMVEKKMISDRKSPAVPSMIIGAGETARRAIKHLQDSGTFRPTVVVDAKSAGKTLDGIPVVADFDAALKGIQAVFIADSTLDQERRDAIRRTAEERGLDLQDYTGYLSNLGGRVPLSSLLELADGPVTVSINGTEKAYENGAAALREIDGRYDVARVKNLKIDLKKHSAAAYEGYEAWAKQHKEETGEEVSFF